MSSLVTRRLRWLIALAALAACTSAEPIATPTQVTVRITSDGALQAVATQLHVRASYRQGENSWRKPVSNSFPTNGLSWPVDVPVFPRGPGEASGQFEVVAEAVQNDVILAQARAITSFVPNRHVQLELRLFACPGREPGFVCTPNCQGTDCSVCNASGDCEAVIPIDSSQLVPVVPPSEMEAGTSPVIGAEAGAAPNPPAAEPDAATAVPGEQVASDAQMPIVTAPDTGAPMSIADAGPVAECDATRPCASGYNCVDGSCVSACMQTRCDANATCSLMSGAPTCTCNRGYIATSGTGTAVVCTQDLACEQLGCDPNAACQLGTDSLRHCVCKNGYDGPGTSCTPVSCPMPTLANGTVSTSNGVVLGSVATYRCNTGFTQGTGSWTRTCGADMQWSGTAPTCNAITCPALSPPTNGTVSTAQGREYGDVAVYSCNSGYAPAQTSVTCQVDGRWSAAAPTCVALCGNGRHDPSETCDPTAPNFNYFNCSDRCQTTALYSSCPGNTGTGASAVGIGCPSNQKCYGYCTPTCSTDSNCPSVPSQTGLAARCVPELAVCVLQGCANQASCPRGMACKLVPTLGVNACVFCQTGDSCSNGQCSIISNPVSFQTGRCL